MVTNLPTKKTPLFCAIAYQTKLKKDEKVPVNENEIKGILINI